MDAMLHGNANHHTHLATEIHVPVGAEAYGLISTGIPRLGCDQLVGGPPGMAGKVGLGEQCGDGMEEEGRDGELDKEEEHPPEQHRGVGA